MNTGAKPRPRATQYSAFPLSAACALILSFAVPAAAKAWRGVVPLASARADVKRLLGPPTHKGDLWHFYDLRDEAAVVWFGDGRCDPWGLRWDVAEGTVTEINVAPKRRLSAALLFNPQTVRTDAKGSGYAVHYDGRAGIAVEAQDGFVLAATFMPGSANSARRCPATEELRHVPHPYPFDMYGDLSREDEWARLDNFANAVQGSPLRRGVIVAYGGRQGPRGEAKARGTRAKNYLVRDRKIGPWRISVIDGGHTEQPGTVLNVLPLGDATFTAWVSPTVPPDEVVIVETPVKKGQQGGRARRRKQ